MYTCTIKFNAGKLISVVLVNLNVHSVHVYPAVLNLMFKNYIIHSNRSDN